MADNDTLSDEKRQEFDEQYKAKREYLPTCSTCQSRNDVVPVVRGRPTHELALYAAEGKIKLSGCTESYQGWCNKCKTYL